MLFNSLQFPLFFVVVAGVYFLLHRRLRAQNLLLLVASYVFYGAWDPRFLGLLGLSTLIDYFAALQIATGRHRRPALVASLVANLGLLAVFKYLNWGIESFVALAGLFGIEAHVATLEIVLPVGISFYTFQTIGYTIDVYRGKREATRDLLAFALYVAYFPQLVAGPIEKASSLLPQLENPRTVGREDFRVGIHWVILGYFKKLVLADTVAPLVDQAFADPTKVTGVISCLSILGFALQIYGDFAGYTLIARGVSRMLGIHLTKNFDAPYFARGPSEFWRRWHISLSSWLQEYLYFSLGGNRDGRWKTYRNLMLTMLLGGLWHGAGWNFVLWGAYHGTLLVAYRAFGGEPKREGRVRWADLPRVLLMFSFTLFGWLLFRVHDLGQLRAILVNIATNFVWTPDANVWLGPIGWGFLALFLYHAWQEGTGEECVLLGARTNPWVRVAVHTWCTSLAAVSWILLGFRANPFIYFQF